LIRRSGSAEFDTKLKMALEVKRRVEDMFVGKNVVASAEENMMNAAAAQAVAPEPELTEDEIEWLNGWVDNQLEPNEISFADCEAALARYPEGKAGAAILARLKETQLLMAKERAAMLRFEKAAGELQRARDALPAMHEEKRQRTAEPAVPDHPRTKDNPPRPNPPNWDKFWDYSRSTYQRLEVEEQDSCAKPIDPSKKTLPPRGDDTGGWRHHWRHGVLGTLRSWADGSQGAAAVSTTPSAPAIDASAPTAALRSCGARACERTLSTHTAISSQASTRSDNSSTASSPKVLLPP